MNKFINNILKEAENSSDDFFQSKHISKRKKDFEKGLAKKKKEAVYKLTKGLEEIKLSYDNKDWKDDKEELFLELFSRLHADKRFYQSNFQYGYCLLDENDDKICFYEFKNDNFWISYHSVWNAFNLQFVMTYHEIRTFMSDMVKKYFKLYNITILYVKQSTLNRLEKHYK